MEIVEQIEEWSWECIMEFFDVVQEYGYFFDIRNIVLGDSNVFIDDMGIERSFPTNIHKIELEGVFANKIGGTEKRYIRDILIRELNSLLIKELNEQRTKMDCFSSSRKRVKVLLDDICIRKSSSGVSYNLFMRIGIKKI